MTFCTFFVKFFFYLFLTASIVWHIFKHICASAVVCCQILLNKHMQVYFPYILYRYNPCMVFKAHHSLDTLWWECYDPLRVKLGDGWPTGDTPDPLEVMGNLADNKQGWTNSVMCCFFCFFCTSATVTEMPVTPLDVNTCRCYLCIDTRKSSFAALLPPAHDAPKVGHSKLVLTH